MKIKLSTMYHKTTNKRKGGEGNAHNLMDVAKWIGHNHRSYSNPHHENNLSRIDEKGKEWNYWRRSEMSYKEWFNSQLPEGVLEEYNNKQNRKDRKKKDFFSFYENKRQAIAEQLIISLGNEETIGTIHQLLKANENYRKCWIEYTEEVVKNLSEVIADFKVFDVALHLDETVPHIHVIGAAFQHTPEVKHGIKFRLASSRVFDRELLKEQHSKLRELNKPFCEKLSQVIEQEGVFWNSEKKNFEKTNTKSLNSETIKFEAIQENLGTRTGIEDRRLVGVYQGIQQKIYPYQDLRIIKRMIEMTLGDEIKQVEEINKTEKIKEGVEIYYHINKKPKFEIPRNDQGQIEGWVKEYNEKGDLIKAIPYVKDKKNGNEKWYYDDGSLWLETTWVNDKEHGEEKRYYKNGNLAHKTFYYEGEKIGKEIEYDFDGNILNEKTHKIGQKTHNYGGR